MRILTQFLLIVLMLFFVMEFLSGFVPEPDQTVECDVCGQKGHETGDCAW